jgi:hypothetical protein
MHNTITTPAKQPGIIRNLEALAVGVPIKSLIDDRRRARG